MCQAMNERCQNPHVIFMIGDVRSPAMKVFTMTNFRSLYVIS